MPAFSKAVLVVTSAESVNVLTGERLLAGIAGVGTVESVCDGGAKVEVSGCCSHPNCACSRWSGKTPTTLKRHERGRTGALVALEVLEFAESHVCDEERGLLAMPSSCRIDGGGR